MFCFRLMYVFQPIRTSPQNIYAHPLGPAVFQTLRDDSVLVETCPSHTDHLYFDRKFNGGD
jgi:hypothetical protein